MAFNILTPKDDSLKQKRIATAYEYYKTRGGSNNVDEWKNNARAYSLEKVLSLPGLDQNDLEYRISQRLSEELRVPTGGVLVPLSQLSTRSDLSATTATLGQEMIQSTIETDFFSGFLYPQSLCLKAGVQVLPAKGNVIINAQTGTTNVSNTGENTPISDSTGVTFNAITAKPVRVTAETIVSRQLLTQSSYNMISLVKQDLAKNCAATVDGYILNATSGSQGFNGVFATSGINSISTSSGGMQWSTIVSFEKAITTANHLLTPENTAWVVSPNVLNSWETKTRLSNGTYSSFFLTNPESKLTISYPTLCTSNLASTDQAVLAKWSESVLATWGAAEVLNDPITYGSAFQNRVLLTLLCYWVAIRPNAFSASSSNAT